MPNLSAVPVQASSHSFMSLLTPLMTIMNSPSLAIVPASIHIPHFPFETWPNLESKYVDIVDLLVEVKAGVWYQLLQPSSCSWSRQKSIPHFGQLYSALLKPSTTLLIATVQITHHRSATRIWRERIQRPQQARHKPHVFQPICKSWTIAAVCQQVLLRMQGKLPMLHQ